MLGQPVEQGAIGGHRDPGGTGVLVTLRVVGDHDEALVERLGTRSHDRMQVQIVVRDVREQHAVVTQMLPVQRRGFEGQQVDRDRVTIEGVEHEHVKTL